MIWNDIFCNKGGKVLFGLTRDDYFRVRDYLESVPDLPMSELIEMSCINRERNNGSNGKQARKRSTLSCVITAS